MVPGQVYSCSLYNEINYHCLLIWIISIYMAIILFVHTFFSPIGICWDFYYIYYRFMLNICRKFHLFLILFQVLVKFHLIWLHYCVTPENVALGHANYAWLILISDIPFVIPLLPPPAIASHEIRLAISACT